MLVGYRHRIEKSNQRDSGLIAYDAKLGWKLTKNWRGQHRHYDFDVQYRTNDYGFRGTFPRKRSQSEKIYAFVGDSFTFSYGVNEGETFVDLLNLMKKREGRIFYNFGVPGYSTDQELLLIKERVFDFRPDVILLVVYMHNDLIDNQYPFPLQASHGKPYFELTSEGLRLRNTPVPQRKKSPEQVRLDLAQVILGGSQPDDGILIRQAKRFDITRWMIPHLRKTGDLDKQFEKRLQKNFRLFNAIVDRMREECRMRSVALKLVLMPGKSFVERPGSVSARFQNFIRKRILKEFEAVNLVVLDLAGHLRGYYEKGGKELFHPNEGHLNQAGHKVVADFFDGRL